MKNTLVAAVVVAIVVGGGAFYGGMKYGQAQDAALRAAARGQFGQGVGGAAGGRGGRGAFGPGANGLPADAGRGQGGFVTGEILSQDAQSITVKMRDGSSKIVLYSGSTAIQKPAPGSASDLVEGQNVMVVGSANSDGSITAESIQLRPAPSSSPSGSPSGQ